MHKTRLNTTDEPVEVDIGEYNHSRGSSSIPYISYLRTSDSQAPQPTAAVVNDPLRTLARSASSIPNSPDRSPSPSSGYTETPPVPSKLPAYLSPLSGHGNKNQGGVGQFNSSSSPALTRSGTGGGGGEELERELKLTRSMTLPRSPQTKTKLMWRGSSEIAGMEMDPTAVEKLRRWILGIAIVEFDLDHGPVVDGIYPPVSLLPAESENLAFSAFPDSPQFEQGSQVHSFRIREQVQSLPEEHPKRRPTLDGFIYGYSHFTQKRDPSSKRGYRQCSTVILTQLQYPAFFTRLASIFGPLYDAHGPPMLESACHNLAMWRDPTPGQTMELGFLGSVLHLEIPTTVDEQQLTETSSFHEKYDARIHILASSSPLIPPPIRLFQFCLEKLWSIWECLLLCEPILILGSSPTQTSQAVWWFRDILRPIPLAGDIRPYFTMQDVDYSRLVNKLPPKAGILLGATNLFFEKSCSHWPHILTLGRASGGTGSATTSKASPALGSTKFAGPTHGWKTKTHKRYISRDRILLKQLEVAFKGNEQTQLEASLALRRHFCSRTRDFLTPLSRYLHTLIPSPVEVSSARDTENIRMKPFNREHFLASLKANGSTLPFRSSRKRIEFYERWLKTPAFGLWLGQQEQIVHVVLKESIRR
ncbi:hypothetical protein AX15_003031 [Amanita polypyramis BW_CC]|nr:hypothetical protein AX15_003031 [Amanita polypyramis BW_CC]